MKTLCKRKCINCLLYKKGCGGCSLCEASICSNRCNTCFSLCPKRPGAFQYLSEIGGLDLILNRSDIDLSNLPLSIPILPDKLKTKINYELLPVASVHAGSLLSRNGEKISKTYLDKGYARALNIDEKTQAILEFYIKDRQLEGFWDRRKELYPTLKKLNFNFIIAPNFSVYEDAPRIDHLYNIKRSVTVYNELIDSGINAVPDVSWYNIKDLERWVKAINKSGIKTIAFSFQTVGVKLKASGVWKSYILGFRYLCQNIDKDVTIIVAGAISEKKVEELYKASSGQKIYILNQSAYVHSRRGVLSEARANNTSLTLDQIFINNLKYFNKTYEDIRKNYINEGGVKCLNRDQVVV